MELKEALITEVNSGLINYDNHSSDNCFSYNTPHEMEWAMKNNGMKPVGYSLQLPYNPYSYPMVAIVFTEDGELCWCHMSKMTWQSFVKRLHGDEVLKSLEG